MKILLTNDDGIQAMGLRSLYHAFKDAGHETHVVAPVSEQSAVGHALTMFMPLRVKRFNDNGFSGLGVYGTPTDCVKLALSSLLDGPPDLVVSGINFGANVGVDILYSGTVSAATEGMLAGLPALAVSMDDFNPVDLGSQARWTVEFSKRMDWSKLPPNHLLNLNFPNLPLEKAKPLAVCPHTRASYRDWYDERVDPRGRKYFWLEGVIPPEKLSPHTDRSLLTKGHITLTPLCFNFNDQEVLDSLQTLLND